LGYLPANEAFIAAPVLVNLGDAPADIRLDYIGKDGQILFSDNTTLGQTQPLRPFARVLGDLLPNAPEEVFVRASSKSQPITGVAFVFNRNFFEPALGNAQTIE